MNAFRCFTRKLFAPLCAGLLAFAMAGVGAAAADGSEGPVGDPSAARNPLTLIAQANCSRPYHVKTPDGRCVWSCSKGTTPDRASGECVCKQGLKETSKDRFGRRVCTRVRANCKRPYHVRQRNGRCVWSCGQGTRPDRASGKCVCKRGYKAKARDRFGRLLCTRGRAGGKRKPDLVIRAFGLKSWGKCKPYNAVFTFQVTVANIGSAPSPAIPAKALVQSMDQHGNGWGQGKVLGSIPPGGSTTVMIPVMYLVGNPNHMTAAAPHPFRAIADPLGLVDELNESNNKSKIIKVGAPKGCRQRGDSGRRRPDLIVQRFSLQGPVGKCVKGNAIYTFVVSVKNIGTALSPAIPAKAMVDARDLHGIAGVANWGNGKILGAIPPGGRQTVRIPVYFLVGNPGHMSNVPVHPFRARADPLGLVSELNEGNNTAKIKVPAPVGCVK